MDSKESDFVHKFLDECIKDLEKVDSFLILEKYKRVKRYILKLEDDIRLNQIIINSFRK